MRSEFALSSVLFYLLFVTACGSRNTTLNPLQNEPVGVPVPSDVRGYLDALTRDGVVEGWALAASLSSQPVDVAAYLDGDSKNGISLGVVTASWPRPDVESTTG